MADEVSAKIPDAVIEALVTNNVKTIGEGPAFLQNLAFANAVGLQAAMGQTLLALTGKVCESIVNTSPLEASGAVAVIGQLMKGLELTNPPSQGAAT